MHTIEKEVLLREFLAESNKIIDLIEQGQYELLSEHLENRETIIGKIDSINQIAAEEAETTLAHERLTLLVSRILEKEKKIQEKLRTSSDSLSHQLQQIQVAKKVNRSYNSTYVSADGYFIDESVKSK